MYAFMYACVYVGIACNRCNADSVCTVCIAMFAYGFTWVFEIGISVYELCMCVCMSVCLYVFVYVWHVCICVYVCLYVCMYACMYVCRYVITYQCMYV